MNALRMTLIALLFIPGISILSAQSNHYTLTKHPVLGKLDVAKLADAEMNYTAGLASDNNGLVESSLYYALQLRLAYPERSFPKLYRAIDELVKDGRSQCIRYKAALACTVFAAPRLIERNQITDLSDTNEFFSSIAQQLESKLLVSSK
ncbi:MAG: hypothetical protein WC824_10105 [Bacteroidota bacterium]|jgi:hypothetical protein